VPDLGDFADVEVIEVLVAAGDTVKPEQGLITVETEKAAMDVPASEGGVIVEMKVTTGDKVSAGDVVAIIQPSAAVAASVASGSSADFPGAGGVSQHGATVVANQPAVGQSPATAGVARGASQAARLPAVDETRFGLAHASPSVRKLARELGVDLGRVQGSGRKQRITADDVKAFVKQVMLSGGTASQPALPSVPEVDFAKFGEVEVVKLSRIQKISGPRLHASWVNLPHVTQHDMADITELETQRKALKADAEKQGIKLTPLAFILRACSLALEEFPTFKASLSADGESLVMKKYSHIGFDADTPNGLVVPVIRDADKKSVFEIAGELGELSALARDGKLRAKDMQGGVFTISSLGGIGGTYFTPIINAPEVAILGVSRSNWQPVYTDKEFVPRLMLPLSLSYDHRVIDGAQAARFITFLSAALGDVDRLLEAGE
jgi:pyruvate dehydrogenase E2 component (dihydrolipoamide acetyltransferase)